MLAVYSAKGPHIDQHDLAAQIGQAQWSIDIEPDFIGELGCRSQVFKAGDWRLESRDWRLEI